MMLHKSEEIDSQRRVGFASLKDSRVSIRRTRSARYPSFPFHPPRTYPECTHLGREKDQKNEVYDAVRGIFADLQLDTRNLGTGRWNPLGRLISPGQRAVVKPNWVLHANQSDGSIESLVTHTSVIRAVVDYLILALRGQGSIEIVDAPLQNCDFGELLRRNMVVELVEFYRRKFPGIAFSVIDLRRTTLQTSESRAPGVARQFAQTGDPRGYTMVDLGGESILTDIHHRFRRFRVANYDHRMMQEHHNLQKHEYLVANSILSADFIVNVPKLKTHEKAGITGALKNLVGINGHKEFLPHHTNGGPETGGDQYRKKSYIKPIVNRIFDDYWKNVNRRSQVGNVLETVAIRALKKVASVVEGDRMYDGAWSGNDTIPRTTLDLNHLLYFYDVERGRLSDTQHRSVLHVVDGVVAGEGHGPLRPTAKDARVVLGGWNPLAIDLCGARLFGIEPMAVPLLRYGLEHEKSRLLLSHSEIRDIETTDDGWPGTLGDLSALGFRMPAGWERAVLPG